MRGVRFEEDIERVDGRHVGDEIDQNAEMARAFGITTRARTLACGSCTQLKTCGLGSTLSE
jgi:hypothetical protein